MLLKNALGKNGTGKRCRHYGATLTGLGNCSLLVALIDNHQGEGLDARQVFLTGGWLLTTGWLLEIWGGRQYRAGVWVTPIWKRLLAAMIPLALLGLASPMVSYVIHDEVAEAAYAGNLRKVQWLAPFDMELSDSPEEDHFTPLYFAIMGGKRDVVVYLLSRGVDPNRPSDHGEIPLKEAKASKQQDIAALLIAAGAHESLSLSCAPETKKRRCLWEQCRRVLSCFLARLSGSETRL